MIANEMMNSEHGKEFYQRILAKMMKYECRMTSESPPQE
jgi:hypothetical protein